MAKSGAMMAMGAGMVFGSPNDAQRHTMEYGDQATRNMMIITIDICQQQTEKHRINGVKKCQKGCFLKKENDINFQSFNLFDTVQNS